MALINLTLGTGGNYTTWEALYAFLVALGAWANDYIVDLVSDVTITSWPSIASRVQQNGHYLKFTCSHNEAIQDAPQNWYVVSFSGVNGFFQYVHDTGADLINDTFDTEYIGFVHLTADVVDLFKIRCWVGSEGSTWSVKNCFFAGYGSGATTAIVTNNNKDYYNIENCLIYNFVGGLNLTAGSFTVGDDFPNRKNVKNATVYTAANGSGVYLGDIDGNNVGFSNVAVFRTGIGACWGKSAGTNPGRFVISNCSDNDNTIVTNLSSSATLSNIQPSILAASNLQSVNSADLGDGFLELIDGTFINGVYTPGASDIGQAGIDASVLTDIYGRDIPDDTGYYPIGAFRQQYLTCHDETETASETNIRKFHSKIEVTWTDSFIDNTTTATANDTNRIHNVT